MLTHDVLFQLTHTESVMLTHDVLFQLTHTESVMLTHTESVILTHTESVMLTHTESVMLTHSFLSINISKPGRIWTGVFFVSYGTINVPLTRSSYGYFWV